jgi:hypothetical protein
MVPIAELHLPTRKRDQSGDILDILYQISLQNFYPSCLMKRLTVNLMPAEVMP